MIKPKLRTFYQDKAIGGLFYFLSKVPSSRNYIFDAITGQRIISQSRFEKDMVEVSDSKAFVIDHPQERVLFERYAQTPPKSTESQRTGRLLPGALFGNEVAELHRIRQFRHY